MKTKQKVAECPMCGCMVEVEDVDGRVWHWGEHSIVANGKTGWRLADPCELERKSVKWCQRSGTAMTEVEQEEVAAWLAG